MKEETQAHWGSYSRAFEVDAISFFSFLDAYIRSANGL